MNGAGIKRADEEKAKLSDIITVLNEKFGSEFDEANKLFFDQIEEELFLDEELKKRALNNPIENFKCAFDEVFINKLIQRTDSNAEIFEKVMEDSEFSADEKERLTKKI